MQRRADGPARRDGIGDKAKRQNIILLCRRAWGTFSKRPQLLRKANARLWLRSSYRSGSAARHLRRTAKVSDDDAVAPYVNQNILSSQVAVGDSGAQLVEIAERVRYLRHHFYRHRLRHHRLREQT